MGHSESDKYVVYVLWVRGHSLTTISRWTRKGVKQLAGIVTRCPWKNRSAMTDQQRQVALNELRAIRMVDGEKLDKGGLDGIDWKVLPLLKGQVK